MDKPKNGTNIFLIIFKSLMIYVKNFLFFTRVMLFPVFGQIAGMFLIFSMTYLYTEKYLAKYNSSNIEQNLLFILLGLILIILPGFAVFIKAFWDYMVAMISLNSMVSDIFKKGNAGNFKIYNNSVKIRTADYVILLLILTLLWLLVLIFPFLSFFAGLFVNPALASPIFAIMELISTIVFLIMSVRLCLVFQIFAFEPIPPVNVIKKSWNMLKGNFWRTVFMGSVLAIVTGWLIPAGITSIIEKSPLISYLVLPFEAYINVFAKNQVFVDILSMINMTPFGFAVELVLFTIGTTITAFMLPWGSACFTLLYFDILDRKKTKRKE